MQSMLQRARKDSVKYLAKFRAFRNSVEAKRVFYNTVIVVRVHKSVCINCTPFTGVRARCAWLEKAEPIQNYKSPGREREGGGGQGRERGREMAVWLYFKCMFAFGPLPN